MLEQRGHARLGVRVRRRRERVRAARRPPPAAIDSLISLRASLASAPLGLDFR